MYITTKIILLLILITTLIVIIKNMKDKQIKEYYENTLTDSPNSILNKVMDDFNKVYKKEISSSIGLTNFIRNYYKN
jgi:hypothetical protein